MRPLGAFLFGIVADRFGRRPTLMVDIMFYSVVELLSGFAPSLTALVILRGLYGIAMGGEWGVGASLTMETIPAKSRGNCFRIVAGRISKRLLVSGRPLRHQLPFSRLARNVYGRRVSCLTGALHPKKCRGITGVATAEWSTTWRWEQSIKGRWKLFIYVIILMTAFNSFSHGTQDIYPTFLQVQHKYPPTIVSTIAVIYNLGAILGGLIFGAFSEHIGRRRAIVIAALLTLPVIPLWAFANNVVLLYHRRLSDPVLCPRRVGRYSSSSERAFARFGARNISRLYLSTGQFFCLEERDHPDDARCFVRQ